MVERVEQMEVPPVHHSQVDLQSVGPYRHWPTSLP